MIIVNLKGAQVSLTNAKIMGEKDLNAFVISVHEHSPIQMK